MGIPSSHHNVTGLSADTSISNGISTTESHVSPTKLSYTKVNPVSIPPLESVSGNTNVNRHDTAATRQDKHGNAMTSSGSSPKSRPPSSRVHSASKPGQGLEKRPEEMMDYLAPLVAPEEPGLSPIDEKIETSAAFPNSKSRASRGNPMKAHNAMEDQFKARGNQISRTDAEGVGSLSTISGDLKHNISKLTEQLSKMDIDIERFEEQEQAQKKTMQEPVDYSITIPAIQVPSVDMLQKDATTHSADLVSMGQKERGETATVAPENDNYDARSDNFGSVSSCHNVNGEDTSDEEEGGLTTETSHWSVGTKQKTDQKQADFNNMGNSSDKSSSVSHPENRKILHDRGGHKSSKDTKSATPENNTTAGDDKNITPESGSTVSSSAGSTDHHSDNNIHHRQKGVLSSEESSAVTSPLGSEPYVSDAGSAVSGSYASALESPDESVTTLRLSATEDVVDMTQSMIVTSDIVDNTTDIGGGMKNVREKAISMEELQRTGGSPMSSPRSAGTSPRSAAHKRVEASYLVQTSRQLTAPGVAGRKRHTSLSESYSEGMDILPGDFNMASHQRPGSDMDVSRLECETIEQLKTSLLRQINDAWHEDSEAEASKKIHTRGSVKVTDLDQATAEFENRKYPLKGGSQLRSESHTDSVFTSKNGDMSYDGIHDHRRPLAKPSRSRYCSEESFFTKVSSLGEKDGGTMTQPPSRTVSLEQVVCKPLTVPEKLDFTYLDKFEGKKNRFLLAMTILYIKIT